jgi:catechol 2,3-dioxygenase-like lactoylglutathione lyase family enzyme
VSLNVSDRARSIAWYGDVLGLHPRSDAARPDDAPVFVGDSLALFADRAPGLRHFAFALSVGDFARAREHVRERGVDARFEDHGSSHSLYFKDPDGHTVELTTYEV